MLDSRCKMEDAHGRQTEGHGQAPLAGRLTSGQASGGGAGKPHRCSRPFTPVGRSKNIHSPNQITR